jgi:hypothetical protein
MCNYSDFIYEKGVSDGEVKGEARGKAEALIQLMKNLKLTFEQALTALSVPEMSQTCERGAKGCGWSVADVRAFFHGG